MPIHKLIALVLLVTPAVAAATPHDFIVVHSGIGGSSEQAAPYLDQFLRYAEKALQWPAGSATGQFFSEPADATRYIAGKHPGFGMLETDLWLELRKKEDLDVLATVVGPSPAAGHLSVVVKDPAFKSLADLKGKRLMANHVRSPRFLSKVIFDGKLDAAAHFQLLPTQSPLKGLKAVDRGEAEATLVDDDQLAHMKTLPFGAGLRVLFTSDPLPPMPVVAFKKNVGAAERDGFAKMLLAMCADPAGAEVCRALHITRFAAPDRALYDEAVRRFGP